MSKQLLIEYMPFIVKPELIKESMDRNNGRLIVSGVLQRANSKNQNSRIYPKNILEREISRYTENEIKQRRALGELDHPESSVVNLRNVSHNLIECWWDGDDVMGKVEILGTPSGNILKELFRANVTVGISSRAVGSVKPLHEGDDQTMQVQDDLEFITFDFVSNPSTQGAFMRPLGGGRPNTMDVPGIGLGEGLIKEGVDINRLHEYAKAEGLVRDIICELSGVCCL